MRIAGLVQDSIVDGRGMRFVVFTQGCPHHCPGCHNPETWPFEGGTKIDTEQIVEIVSSNPLCRGVTFSGGEPFAQAEGFAELADRLKSRGYEVAAYSGYTFEELLNGTQAQRRLLETIDILIDGPFRLEERSLELVFRGSRNQRILSVPASLAAGAPVLETSGRWLGKY